jgi:hypothetical protein
MPEIPEAAVLIIVFNRPDKTRALIDALSLAKPKRIYISADGPRSSVPGEKERCDETRRIATNISWPCEVKTRFSPINLGCKVGVSSAITWFFKHVEEGVILEDDCIPSPSFLPFCANLLNRYRTNDGIMHINGTTFLGANDPSRAAESYHFSRLPHVWGWATWKRAWDSYDIEMRDINSIADYFPHVDFWKKLFRHVQAKGIDTWDAQWAYSIMSKKGIVITPNINLIENIGFDSQATHTQGKNDSAQKALSLTLPLIHPHTISIDQKADEVVMKKVYLRSFWKKLMSLFR